MVTLVLP